MLDGGVLGTRLRRYDGGGQASQGPERSAGCLVETIIFARWAFRRPAGYFAWGCFRHLVGSGNGPGLAAEDAYPIIGAIQRRLGSAHLIRLSGKSLARLAAHFVWRPALSLKIFFFRFSEPYDLFSSSCFDEEGRYGQSSRNARRDAVDAGSATDERAVSRTVKPRGSGAPLQASSS